MLVFITALFPEAAAVASAFSMKKSVSRGSFTLYEGEDASFRLLVTGAGKLNAAIAVTEYLSLSSFSDTDIFCNLGICGTAAALPKGSGFLCVSVTDLASHKAIYPEVYGHPFREALLATSDTPVTGQAEPSGAKCPVRLPQLFDMEAYGVASALFRLVPPSHCFFYKVVSDFCDGTFPSAKEVTALLQPHLPALSAFLQETAEQLSEQAPHRPGRAAETAEALSCRYLFSATMKHRLLQLLTYAELAGIKTEDMLSAYTEGEKTPSKKTALTLLNDLEQLLKNPGARKAVPSPALSPAGKKLLQPFRHIYVERGAERSPAALRLYERFPEASFIPIDHYKDVFNRSRQNLWMQETGPSLILAVNRGRLFYPGAPVCQSFGEEHFLYTSCAMNCLYDCDYCYLQGMYPSGNIVVFVNLEDYFAELDRLLSRHPVYLCCSYDSDLAALNGIFPHAEAFCRYAAEHPGLRLELRTKGAPLPLIQKLPPAENVIFAFTLSPQELITRYEHYTPSLLARLAAAREAAERGFSLRLCFDPLLDVPEAERLYTGMLEQVFSVLSPEDITDVSLGVFRISGSYLKQLRRAKPSCPLSFYPYELTDGVCHYRQERCNMLLTTVQDALYRHGVTDEKIFIWTPDGSGKGDSHAD